MKRSAIKAKIFLDLIMLKLLLLSCISWASFLYPTEKHPVDVCFMVADLKYSREEGVKICEIQPGSLSLFNGNTYRCKEEKSIHKELLDTLSEYNTKGWLVANSLADKSLISTLEESWHSAKDLLTLYSDPNFLEHAKKAADDKYDLSTYQGFLYVNWSHLCAISDFEERYPGMVILDKSAFCLWNDKYLMSELFNADTALKKLKPKWGCYKKNYSNELANQIRKELDCDTFVIKPRGECLGKGVVIVSDEELDAILEYISTNEGRLAESKSTVYTYWKNDPFDSFIVEEFVASDLITIPHLQNKTYQPTMRVAFLLVYDNHVHRVHFLGEYWKTPSRALEDEGDFMKKNKDICKAPYYAEVAESTKLAVRDELGASLALLHRKMIERSENTHQVGCQMIKKSQLQLHRTQQLTHLP